MRNTPELPINLDDLLAPVRAEFAASGITEEELDAIIEKERQAIWEERQLSHSSLGEPQ